MTDAELIRAVQAGDETALDTVYRRYLPALWRYAFSRLAGHCAAAEDAVSETFLAAVRQVRTLDPEGGSLGGWLMGIARHKVLDVHRRARRAPVEAPDDLADPARGAGPEAPLETAETRRRVAAVLDRLPDDQRLALEWKYVDGLSVREIAGRLGRTEKGAEAVLYRARGAFRETYERADRPDA